ncbi:hypothetical protein H6G41_22125 [Tolypothrix sp. FACHB-123]|uniref:hypothetical protein n=1 Tax=Tolypothrix sp. FACHB-123 TaxID=2692868 RepID=UPI0016893231|nr:hypothetical protein [Tolypothrix sp. FACHB-123]MBD2357283.1 hypothetical protein [Tolypothrix sp. FACHB-123]
MALTNEDGVSGIAKEIGKGIALYKRCEVMAQTFRTKVACNQLSEYEAILSASDKQKAFLKLIRKAL